MENLEQKRLGLRIKSVRILTGLNQEEFAKACDFNHTSLRNWEFGRVVPRKEAIERLIEAFRTFSIFIERDWIFHGRGEGPVFTATESKLDPVQNWSDEMAAFKKTCAAKGENALILKLEDDEMAPLYCKGDWIGAAFKSLNGLLEHPQGRQQLAKPMLVKLEDKKFHLRRVCLDGSNFLARSENNYLVSRIVGDLVGIVLIHLSSALHPINGCNNASAYSIE